MIPYVLLLLIPALFCFVAIKKTGKRRFLCVGNNDYIKENSLAVAVFFIVFFILLVLRDETIGRDLVNYKYRFDYYCRNSFDVINVFETESLYRILNWVVGSFTHNYHIFLGIVAALTLLPIALLYNEDRRHAYLKIILFLNMSTFMMIFSGIRQALALGVGMIAYRFVRKKQWLAFLLMVVLALWIHHSGFMLLFMYPLYHISFKRKHLWIVIPGILATFIFNRQIFQILNIYFASYMEDFDMSLDVSDAVTSIILFALFAIACYVIPDEKSLDQESLGLRNFMVFAVFLQCFAPVHTLAMRMNYYYIMFIPILLPRLLSQPSPAFRQVAKLARIVLSVFFTVYYLYSVYIGCKTGISALDIYPYVPFWD